jgi:hypothetical protein
VIKINSINTIKNRQSRASCIVIKLKIDQFGSNTIKNRQSRASCIIIKLKKRSIRLIQSKIVNQEFLVLLIFLYCKSSCIVIKLKKRSIPLIQSKIKIIVKEIRSKLVNQELVIKLKSQFGSNTIKSYIIPVVHY